MPNKIDWLREIRRQFAAGNLCRSAHDIAEKLAGYWNQGYAWPAHATLAGLARCSVSTVQRALRALRRLGLLEWWERRRPEGWRSVRSSNLYEFRLPRTAGHSDRGSQRQIVTLPSFGTRARVGELLAARRAVIERRMQEHYARFR